ncbi:MAG: pyrroloquinoline quinone biosynthesis protein PqqB [Chthoniobacterales bacterium]
MLEVLILGTAAGGGFPQWNCACENCILARAGALSQRLQSSVAITGNGRDWHLVNASPDVGRQIEQFIRPRLEPGDEQRDAPVRSIFLTNADLDHTLGIFQLREGRPLTLVAPPSVRQSLERGPGLSHVVGAYAGLNWLPAPDQWHAVDPTGLEVRTVPLVGSGPPRYDTTSAAGAHAVGYVFRKDGRTAGIFPDVAVLDDALQAELKACDRVWFDGTFWDEDELVRLGFSARRAADMGHVPISESLPVLSALGPDRAEYLHINNTNPVLRPDSEERKRVESANLRVAVEGGHFVV